jgi:uncharacterized membrane protein YbhN (UPF0104 family)
MGLGRSGLARFLVGLGFTLVGVGNLVWVGLDSPSPSSANFFWIVTAVGFVLLGVALWAWLKTLSTAESTDPRMRIVLRLCASACLVLGIAYLGLVNELIQLDRRGFHSGVRRQAVSYALSLGGFCLAAVGFLMVSVMLQSHRPQLRQEEVVEPARSDTGP